MKAKDRLAFVVLVLTHFNVQNCFNNWGHVYVVSSINVKETKNRSVARKCLW